MRKIINVFALLLVFFVIVCICGIFPININDYEVPLLVIIGATALINVSTSLKTYLVKPGRYTFEPDKFVDRKSQIQTILAMAYKGRHIINVFGITGIGVTRLQQFSADIINKRIPFLLRRQYCNNISILLGNSHRGYYINVNKVVNAYDIISLLYESVLIGRKSDNTITEFCKIINRKLKSKRLIYFFDGIHNQEQMILIEEIASQYFTMRSKDTFVFGTHQKSLSYQYNYHYVKIMEFNKNDLMILAKAHKIQLDEKTSMQLYEITDGIPMFAYLLLRDQHILEMVNSKYPKDIYAYLKQFVIPSLLDEERATLEKIALLSLSNSIISNQEIQLVGLTNHDYLINNLYYKGLIQFSMVKNEITIPKAIAKLFLVYSHIQEELCFKLYQHYKKTEKKHFAVLYLLLSEQHDNTKERFIENNIMAWIRNRDVLTMLAALSPTIELSTDIKRKYPKLYVQYLYACIYMLASCGEYIKAKELLEQLIVDGEIIQRYDSKLNDKNFNLHFIWADVEHLLNNYDSAIQIINSLIYNSQQNEEIQRFPQLYWMQAHCMRHQAKDLQASFDMYKLCEKEALEQNNQEYVIRSLHGQICISLILNSTQFEYESIFNRLHCIYTQSDAQWDVYKYNTYKYESIYKRIYGSDADSSNSLLLLQKARDGYISIRKRNIYDVFFELGEYYRYYAQYNESKKYYSRCIEFAQYNSDYNLKSLAELGIILVNISTGDYCQEEKLLTIIREAQQSDLNLSANYGRTILEYLKDNVVSFTLQLFNP